MHREYINYSSNLPLSISYSKIDQCPIHWHYSIEIIYVLQGSIDLFINTNKFKIYENQVKVINLDEVHSIQSNDPDNRVLMFHIDPYFFQKYYDDIENMLFYLESSPENNQLDDEYEDLRIFLSQILCEIVQKQDNYDEAIEEILIKLLYHLINNFNYLIYQKEELKDDEGLLQRYHNISKYIYNNYKDNITLKDISNNEYLSTHYLSREIKYATGYAFTDLLNFTRAKESVKLLLDTDMTLSEISEEVGFSHTRYFNKHFKLHYKLTPLQFRKKYRTPKEDSKKTKKNNILSIEESLDFVVYYLEDYDRFNYDDKIHQLNLNMSHILYSFNNDFNKIITVGDAFDLLIEDNKDTLEELQGEMDFTFGRILNLFSTDMAIFPSGNFYNWNRCKDVLEFLDYLNIIPIIVLDLNTYSQEEFKTILLSFIEYFSAIDTINYRNIKFQFSSSFPTDLEIELEDILETNNIDFEKNKFHITNETNNIYDTTYMLPFIINNVINNTNSLDFLRAFDVLDKQVNITNEVFFGYPGLINDKGIKKPSFYAFALLNKLGNIVIDKGDGYIVTKSSNQYQILLYTHHEDISELISLKSFLKLRGIKNATSKKISLNITNINSDINITTYEINEKIGSSYNYWVDMGKPTRLNKEEKGILHKASYPRIGFKYFKKSTIVNILATLQSYGAMLIIINEVNKNS